MQTDGHFFYCKTWGKLPISLIKGLIPVLLAPDVQELASGDRLCLTPELQWGFSGAETFWVYFLDDPVHFIVRTLSHETCIKAIRRFLPPSV